MASAHKLYNKSLSHRCATVNIAAQIDLDYSSITYFFFKCKFHYPSISIIHCYHRRLRLAHFFYKTTRTKTNNNLHARIECYVNVYYIDNIDMHVLCEIYSNINMYKLYSHAFSYLVEVYSSKSILIVPLNILMVESTYVNSVCVHIHFIISIIVLGCNNEHREAKTIANNCKPSSQ